MIHPPHQLWSADMTKYFNTWFNHGVPMEAVSKVFNEELLRAKILDFVVHDAEEKLNPAMVAVVRTVQKSWLCTTSKLLLKYDTPIICLDEKNLPSKAKGLKDEGSGKPLKDFTEVFTDQARLQQSFLPFKMVIKLESFSKETYQTVLECLNCAEEELVVLDIKYPADADADVLPLISFPNLRKLIFAFSNDVINPGKNNDHKHNSVYTLQLILHGSKRLKKLAIGVKAPDTAKNPVGLQFLRLPDTIISLELWLKLKSEELEGLVFHLSKLKHLKLKLGLLGNPFKDGLMHKIFERFSKTLESFLVYSVWMQGTEERDPSPKNFLQFPVMKKLETLHLNSVKLELGPREIPRLGEYLPKLSRLYLCDQSENMLTKWIDNYQSDQVEKLSISVIDERLGYDNENFFVSINPESMAKVKTGFPNLRDLNVDVNIGDLRVLKYMFQEMKQLEKLQTNLRGNLANYRGRNIQEVVIGIPMELLQALKFSKTYEMKDDQQVGIMNLVELRDLRLCTENYGDAEPEETSIVSDLLFEQAFLKMPKLRNLMFYGKFRPSLTMQQNWKAQEGRTISYSPKWNCSMM